MYIQGFIKTLHGLRIVFHMVMSQAKAVEETGFILFISKFPAQFNSFLMMIYGKGEVPLILADYAEPVRRIGDCFQIPALLCGFQRIVHDPV